jgi:predicted MFS family arabinose efflux permease
MHDYVFGDNFIASFILQVVWTLIGSILCFIVMDDKKIQSKKSVPMFKVLKTLNVKQIIFFIALFMFSVGMISVSKFFEPFFQSVNSDSNSVSSYLAHFTTISNIVSILVMLFFIPVIKKYFKKKSNLLFTILLLVSAILVLIVFTNRNIDTLIVLFFTVYLLYIVVKNIMTPLEQNITIENSKEEDFTALLSFRQSILSFGQVLGPILLANAFSIDMHIPFFVAAGLFIVGFILMIIYLILNKKEHNDVSDNK